MQPLRISCVVPSAGNVRALSRIGLVEELKRDGHPPQSGCPIRKREEIVVIVDHQYLAPPSYYI